MPVGDQLDGQQHGGPDGKGDKKDASDDDRIPFLA